MLRSFELGSRQVACFFPLVRRRANSHKDQASVASAFQAWSSGCMDSTNLGVILPKPFQQPSAIELSYTLQIRFCGTPCKFNSQLLLNTVQERYGEVLPEQSNSHVPVEGTTFQKQTTNTWSFELSLISAHLEKTAFCVSFLEVGVFASYCSSLEKSGCLFPSNWRFFPSNGRLFPSHARIFFFLRGCFFLKNEVGRNQCQVSFQVYSCESLGLLHAKRNCMCTGVILPVHIPTSICC